MGNPDAENLLLDVCKDEEAPAFTRAGALLAMRRFISDASFEEARRNLDSNQSVIRTAAISKFEGLPISEAYDDLIPKLSDPIRSVRTEAARLLARGSIDTFR